MSAIPDKSDLRELVKEYVAMGFHIYATSGTASRLNSVGISSTLVKKPKEAKEGEKTTISLLEEGKDKLRNFHFQDGTPAGTRQCPPEKKGSRAWYSVPDIA